MFLRLNQIYMEEAGGDGEGGGAGGGAGGDGSSNGNEFLTALPEEYRDNPALRDFKDAGSLAKSYLNTKTMVGNSIRIPGEDAGDEDRQAFVNKIIESAPNVMLKPNFEDGEQAIAFYRSIGMPEAPNEYQMPEVEGVQYPEERVEFLQAAAHEAGITKTQFGKVMGKLAEADVAMVQARQEQVAAYDAEVRQEWGNAYDQNSVAVLAIAEKTDAPSDLIEAIKNKALPPSAMKWMYGLSEGLTGKGKEIADQGDQHEPGILTPEEAKAQIAEINGNKAHPYWDGSHPGHKEAMDKMIKLMLAANPGSVASMDGARAGMGG